MDSCSFSSKGHVSKFLFFQSLNYGRNRRVIISDIPRSHLHFFRAASVDQWTFHMFHFGFTSTGRFVIQTALVSSCGRQEGKCPVKYKCSCSCSVFFVLYWNRKIQQRWKPKTSELRALRKKTQKNPEHVAASELQKKAPICFSQK